VLRQLQTIFPGGQHQDLIVGLEEGDDAAVYRISDDLAIIQTLDFFTPVVDDPYDYGAIAAANAMSDIYAMGGEVTLALNICAFPADLPAYIVGEILRGGAEKVAEAGGVLVGGHTIQDKEPKYGLSVMGLVHPDRVLTKAGARPGDALMLTKPLGVGIITTALKGSVASAAHVEAAVNSMKKLNREATRLARSVSVHACTDITGFSLLGHGLEMANKSGVRLRLHLDHIPFLDGAVHYAHEWLFPGGARNNQRTYHEQVEFAHGIVEEMRMLLFTPETSGGLLVAVPPDSVPSLVADFGQAGQPCWVIGEVVEGQGIEVTASPPGTAVSPHRAKEQGTTA
jgi:selenide, water dikinase